MTTVGVGQPAYLEMQINSAIKASDIAGVIWTLATKPQGSSAAFEDSPLTSDVPLFEPSDQAVLQVAGRKMLRADVPGMYVVTATVTAGASGTATISQTIIAATYTGRAACETCHSGGLATVKAPTWAKTAHASLFTEAISGGATDHYAATCIGCHTVGYDANAKAVNGGFDDIAKEVGWTFPTSMVPANWSTMSPKLQNVANIQCENCHGPGSQHVKSGGDTIQISVPSSTGSCAFCHDSGSNHIKTREWKASMHAAPTRDPSGAGREGCVGCHTGNGFIDVVNGVTPPRTTFNAITCGSCHESHGQTAPTDAAHLVRKMTTIKLQDGTQISGGGMGKLCMNCHMSRRNAVTYVATTAGNSHFGPHSGPQADMLAGTNAITYGKKIPSSAHSDVVGDSCVTCHMQTVASTDTAFLKAGGHTFKMSATSADGKTTTQLLTPCQGCHGSDTTTFNFPLFDYDGDGNYDGVQTEVRHLLDQLGALLPNDFATKGEAAITASWTKQQLAAAYNYLFVESDGSLGVHNTAYAVGILKGSINDMKTQK